MLERLKEDAGEAKGTKRGVRNISILTTYADVEGGADCWPRPKLGPIDEKRDTISKCTVHAPPPSLSVGLVFQQIDVEDCYEGGTVGFRMFGVTEVSLNPIMGTEIDTCAYPRRATASWLI